MRFPVARRRLQALSTFSVVSSIFILSGCTPASPKGKENESPPREKAAAPATPPGGERKEIPQAVKELKEKLQPPGAALTAAPSSPPSPSSSPSPSEGPRNDAPLILAAQKMASSLVEALRQGDTAAAEKHTLTEEQFSKVVTPGHREILAGHILPQNKAVIQRLIQTVKDKKVQHTFKPGPIEMNRPGSAFVGVLPIMTQGILVLDLEGVQIQVQMDQLLYIDGQWTIFRLRAL